MKGKAIKEIINILKYNASYCFNYPLINPRVLQISLTNRCNLHCKMCSVSKYRTSKEEEMDLSAILQLIDDAKKIFKVKDLILTGGEPLLLGKDLVRIVIFARSKDINVILTTNGFYLQEYAVSLVQAGVNHFHISVDGFESVHNELRQNDISFVKAIEAIKNIVHLREKINYAFTIGFSTLILKNNVDTLCDLYKYADELGADIFDLLPYLSDNSDFSNMETSVFWLEDKDVDKLKEVYGKIITEETKQIKLNPVFDIKLIDKYYRRQLKAADWRCFAGYKNFFITMSDPEERGVFEPCLFLCKKIIPLRRYNFDLKKIWYSYEAKQARKDIKKCSVYCYQLCFALPKIKDIFIN